jgi:hypothetical protein
MTYCRCHCRDCGSHFSSLEAFDAHHQGSGASLVPCVFPEDAALLATGGTCTIEDPDRRLTGVTVYATERSLASAEYFRGFRGRESEPVGRKQAVLTL